MDLIFGLIAIIGCVLLGCEIYENATDPLAEYSEISFIGVCALIFGVGGYVLQT